MPSNFPFKSNLRCYIKAEATEDEACRNAYGPGAWTRPASADLTGNLKDKIASFGSNLAQAARSDDALRRRIDDAAAGVLSLLDPVALGAATPVLAAPMLSTAADAAVAGGVLRTSTDRHCNSPSSSSSSPAPL
jgi:hypothetical protein